MGTISYLFERIASLTFIVPCVWSAMHHRGRFVHLTWWSLVVHALYFNVDKASTPATLVARVLHATSYCGAFAVAVGYTLLVLGGSSHAGGWHAWEKKVEVHRLVSQGGSPDDCDPGTVCQAPLWYTAAKKVFEHYWPVVAVVLDARLSRDELRRVYAGVPRGFALLLGMGCYLSLGLAWEASVKKGGKENTMTTYQQPPWLSSEALLGQIGLESHAAGLAEDFVFATGQKVLLVLFGLLAYNSCLKGLKSPKQKGA